MTKSEDSRKRSEKSRVREYVKGRHAEHKGLLKHGGHGYTPFVTAQDSALPRKWRSKKLSQSLALKIITYREAGAKIKLCAVSATEQSLDLKKQAWGTLHSILS